MKLRVLCLHGYGQAGQALRAKTGALRSESKAPPQAPERAERSGEPSEPLDEVRSVTKKDGTKYKSAPFSNIADLGLVPPLMEIGA